MGIFMSVMGSYSMQKIVLINGRFELLNSEDKVEVYDIRNLKKNNEGKVMPVEVVPVGSPLTDKDAGKLALTKLHEKNYISLSEYLTFLDIFLASLVDGISYRNIKKTASVQGRVSPSTNQ